MGCDIHIRTEIKRNHKWVNADFYEKSRYYEDGRFDVIEIYGGRSYSLFSTLADVRNNHNLIEPICQAKGIPVDASDEYRELCERWEGDGHSHSYFTLQELEDVFDKHSVVTHKGLINQEQIKELEKGNLPNSWCQGTNQEGYEWRSWEDKHYSFIHLVENLRSRLNHYHPWDSDDHKSDIRIVFFFDN